MSDIFSDVSLAHFLFALAVFVLAAFVHGAVGLGFPMIATPILAMSFGVKQAIFLTLIPGLFINVISILREQDAWRSLQRFLPVSLIASFGSFWGTTALLASSPEPFRLLLAFAILFYLSIEKFRKKRIAWIKPHPLIAKIIFGMFAGLLGGMTNVMAPVLVIYFIEIDAEPKSAVVGLNFCFLLGKIVQLALFIDDGAFQSAEIFQHTPLLFFALAALWSGINLRKKITAFTWRNWLKKALLIIALVLIVQASSSLILACLLPCC